MTFQKQKKEEKTTLTRKRQRKIEKMPIDLYGLVYSPPCRSVLLLAKAIGVHLNLKTVSPMDGEHMKPDFLKVRFIL